MDGHPLGVRVVRKTAIGYDCFGAAPDRAVNRGSTGARPGAAVHYCPGPVSPPRIRLVSLVHCCGAARDYKLPIASLAA